MLFCRDGFVVLVSKVGHVTYMDMQLRKVHEFDFDVPVTAADCCCELWTLISDGRLLLCQDKFYVQ